MFNKATYTLIFDRKKKASAKSEGVIEILIYFDKRNKRYLSTKIKVLPLQWDEKNRVINSKHSNSIELNQSLKQMIYDIEKFELSQKNYGKGFNVEKLNDWLKSNKQPLTFNKFFSDHLKADLKLLPQSAKPQYRSLELLNEFNSNISFAEVDYSFIHSFDAFLYEKGFAPYAVWRIHKDLRKFINLAINFKYLSYDQYPYRTFKLVKPRNKHVYLNYNELAAVEQIDVSDVPDVQLAKDIFLMQCYTGLRFSDVSTLNVAQIIKDKQGYKIILQRMQKVDRRLVLKLWELFNGKPNDLVKKYAHNLDAGCCLFGVKVYNSKLNINLKTLQAAAELNKTLTTHVGRHTFGTLYAHKTGSIFEVMKTMGISKYETAKIYIDLSEEL